MKIVKLEIDSVKRIKAFHINPAGDVILTGKNGAGKSSVLDSIEMALGQKKVSQPINNESKKGKTIIELDNGLIVTKSYTGKNEYLKVEDKTGVVKSPAALLSKLVGKISFDPLEFSRMQPKQQREILTTMCPDLDFSKLDSQRKNVYDLRTLANRDIKNIKGELENLGEVDLNFKAVDPASLTEKLNKLHYEKKEYEELERKYNFIKNTIKDNEDKIQKYLEELQELKEENEIFNNKITEISQELEKTDTETLNNDIKEVEKRLSEMNIENKKANQVERYKELTKKQGEIEQDISKYEKKLQNIDEMKAMRLETANLPVNGLSISDSGICFKDIEFSNLSTSEQLKISFSMAMALNPELKVVFIRDGSLLDQESKDLIFKMAADHGFQVWMEVTDTSGMVGVVIEDGVIKKIN